MLPRPLLLFLTMQWYAAETFPMSGSTRWTHTVVVKVRRATPPDLSEER